MRRDQLWIIYHRLNGVIRPLLAGVVFSALCAGTALAYVGNSYLQIPDIPGGWQGKEFTDWVKVDGNYWQTDVDYRGGFRRDHTSFGGPTAPKSGKGEMVIAFNKGNPILPRLMEACRQKTTFPEVTYAESSVRSRAPFEWGPRPAEIPEYYKYKLSNVQFTKCPVVADAPDQAIVVSFGNIEWLNYQSKDDGKGGTKAVDITMEPAKLGPAEDSGTTKSFVVTWFGMANDVSDDQCPVLAKKPDQDLYYRYMSKEEAAKERAEHAKSGGVNYENGDMGGRGPDKLDVTKLPGIVPDPIQPAPQTTVARGLDLDGDDGTGEPPAGICKHKNYVSEDGRSGIDNQLYRAQGCIPGWQGHKGFIIQFANNAMRDGQYSMLIQISGIDNEKNDDSVTITWMYSDDDMVKNGAGTQILPDYTFRVTDDPEFSHYFSRTHGRIVDGVILSDRIDNFQKVLGVYGVPMELLLKDARIRLQLASDGTIKGVVGGYRDWKREVLKGTEVYFNYQMPGDYNALKRNADGLKDPVTGECDGISTAYDIEGIPAFIVPSSPQKSAQAESAFQ